MRTLNCQLFFLHQLFSKCEIRCRLVKAVADPRGLLPARAFPLPRTDPNFLNFMHFFGENLANLYVGAPSGGLAAPPRRILDPPLKKVLLPRLWILLVFLILNGKTKLAISAFFYCWQIVKIFPAKGSSGSSDWMWGGIKKHEIYVAAFGSHLFMTYFYMARGSVDPLLRPPPKIRYLGTVLVWDNRALVARRQFLKPRISRNFWT